MADMPVLSRPRNFLPWLPDWWLSWRRGRSGWKLNMLRSSVSWSTGRGRYTRGLAVSVWLGRTSWRTVTFGYRLQD